LMNAATGIGESRYLRNRDGSVFQLTPEYELHSVDIRITWRPVTEDFVEDDDDPALAISRPCLSALPKARDRFGFVEYDDEDGEEEEEEEEEESRYRRHNAVIPSTVHMPAAQCRLAGPGDWILVDAGIQILDVNDTSAMIAAGIDPSEPHPNPEAFYLLNHPTDNQSNIHGESQEISSEKDTKAYNCSFNHDLDHSSASDNSVDNSMFKQSLRSTQNKADHSISMCLQKLHKSGVVQKWISKPLKNTFSGQKQRSTQCTAAEIRRIGPGMDRSYTDAVTSARAAEWIHQLPGGRAAAGRFDRDWLDAQPSSSSSTVQPRRK
jgi:FtsZ-interacting cell division protein YlmF